MEVVVVYQNSVFVVVMSDAGTPGGWKAVLFIAKNPAFLSN